MKFILGLFAAALITTVAAAFAFGQEPANASSTIEKNEVIGAVKPDNVDTRFPVSLPAKPPQTATDDPRKGYASFKYYVFKVKRSDDDVAYQTYNVIVSPSSISFPVVSTHNFDWGVEHALKAEGGWSGRSGFGVRASFFHTDQTEKEVVLVPQSPNVSSVGPFGTRSSAPIAGSTASYTEKFRMNIVDAEATYRWHSNDWTALISGGLRIADIEQTYRARSVRASTITVGVTNTLGMRTDYTQERTGFGPTGAAEFRRRLGGNVWFTGTGRAALVMGSIKELATRRFDAPPPPALPFDDITVSRSSSPKTWAFEGEAGLEWVHRTSEGELFFSGNFILHHWRDVVIAIPVAAEGQTLLNEPANSPASLKGSVQFLGGSFSVGFRF